MASIFSEGNVPKRWDTRWSLLMKILGATVEAGSGGQLSGSGPPIGDPGFANARYIDLDSGREYYWNPNTSAWVEF